MSTIDEAIKQMNRVAAEHKTISALVWEGRGKTPDDTLPDRIRTILALWDNACAEREKALARLEAVRNELRHVQNVLALRERQGAELVEFLKPHIPEKMNEPEVFAGVRGALARIAELEAKLAAYTDTSTQTPSDPPAPTSLAHDLAAVLNKWSAENGSNTPDWILADYLLGVLGAFDHAMQARAKWYGRMDAPGQSTPKSGATVAVTLTGDPVTLEALGLDTEAARRAEFLKSIAVSGGVREADEPADPAGGWATIAGGLWDTLAEIAGLDPNDDVLSKSQYRGAVRKLAGRRLDLIAPEHVHRGGPLPTRATDDARELGWLRDIYDRAHLKPAMLSNTTGQKWAIVPLEQVVQVGAPPCESMAQPNALADIAKDLGMADEDRPTEIRRAVRERLDIIRRLRANLAKMEVWDERYRQELTKMGKALGITGLFEPEAVTAAVMTLANGAVQAKEAQRAAILKAVSTPIEAKVVDKLATSDISKERLVELLRQAQAERDQLVGEKLKLESELERIEIARASQPHIMAELNRAVKKAGELAAERAPILERFAGTRPVAVRLLRRPTDTLGERLHFETWVVSGPGNYNAVSGTVVNANVDPLSATERAAMKAMQAGTDPCVFVSAELVAD